MIPSAVETDIVPEPAINQMNAKAKIVRVKRI
jgi:hypothetical protein